MIVPAECTEPVLLEIADIVARHRPEPACMAVRRAAWAFSCLPGCSVFLAAEAFGGYLAFLRDGRRVRILIVEGRDRVPPGVAEHCAVMLYGWACAGQVPIAVTVRLA
jgi:hypothetical protein